LLYANFNNHLIESAFMAGNLNKVLLIGNVGKDPEIRATQDGKEIANLVIATSESWKSKATGERQEKTEWHRVVIFSEGLVSIVKSYVKKGTKLYIEGALKTRKWVDNTGQEKYTTEIVLQGYNATLTILDSKNSDFEKKGDNGQEHSSLMEELDDEIPF